jgi:hypothetical protein
MADALLQSMLRIEKLLKREQTLAAAPPKHGAGVPPWHMWGGHQTMAIPQSAGGASSPLVPTPGQVTRISYGRPETWRWMFGCKLLAGPDTTAIGQHVSLGIHFDLSIGIGRSVMLIPDFELYQFNWDDGQAFPQDRFVWSSQSITPGRTFVAPATSTNPGVCDHFVAQDIQCTVRCFLQELSIPSAPVTVELSALFAPNVHLRPEWHLHTFPGGEEK